MESIPNPIETNKKVSCIFGSTKGDNELTMIEASPVSEGSIPVFIEIAEVTPLDIDELEILRNPITSFSYYYIIKSSFILNN